MRTPTDLARDDVRPAPERGGGSDDARQCTGTNTGTGKASQTREAIIGAATDAFAEWGYAKTAMADVAARAGTSVGLLYYHFGRKEALFYAIWDEYQSHQEERLRDTIAAAQADGIDDGLELLLVGARAYLEGAWQGRVVYQVVHLKDGPPGFSERSPLVNERWTRKNQRLIEADDALLSRAMLAAVLGALGAWCREVVGCGSDDEARALIDRSVLILAGLVHGFDRIVQGEPVIP
jgi:AcrR family transcriptional regulator